MDFLPWSTFTRIVARYGGDQRVRTLSCAEHYRAMAFAQLTYRESLRDIEMCLSVQASKLYSMGFRDPVRRSTLADANEARDWRIYAELAQRLIVQARKRLAPGGNRGRRRAATFSYRLDRDKLRQVRSREGRYLLRTNLVEEDPAKAASAAKERAIRRRQLKRLWVRLKQLSTMQPAGSRSRPRP